MSFFIKKINIIALLILFLIDFGALAKDNKIKYTRENISNYFFGTVSLNQDYSKTAFKYLKKIQSIKNHHSEFNIQFIRTLVLLEKFDQAFNFSKSIWKKEELFFETDLLLGLNYFLEEDYENAEMHFRRLNKISKYNLVFDDFVGNVLIAWSKASQGKKDESFKYINTIPEHYRHLTNTQNIFLQCYFNLKNTQESLNKLLENEDYNFSRYNFFLINYLISKNETTNINDVFIKIKKKYSSNLLLKQTESFFLNNKSNKIIEFFDCQNPTDSIAEFFYILSNLYSSEREYQLSNFYLKISLFLNKNFLSNEALLAENFYYQKKNSEAKKKYLSIKSIGPVYSWYASKNIATILIKEKGKEYAIKALEKDFNSLPKVNYEHYYDLANFYKDNEYYEESINYYSLVLKELDKDHFLVPKILDRRGTSYERIGKWEKAEEDLTNSLKILPDQPHVLNYLAYTWIDKGINLDKGLEMLKKATELREDDGYIIDSLGWAYYAKKNYDKAEFFLQRAVELMPSDPIINDHYADTLWMLNKNIQARYVWNYILNLEDAEENLKDNIRQKILFGIKEKL